MFAVFLCVVFSFPDVVMNLLSSLLADDANKTEQSEDSPPVEPDVDVASSPAPAQNLSESSIEGEESKGSDTVSATTPPAEDENSSTVSSAEDQDSKTVELPTTDDKYVAWLMMVVSSFWSTMLAFEWYSRELLLHCIFASCPMGQSDPAARWKASVHTRSRIWVQAAVHYFSLACTHLFIQFFWSTSNYKWEEIIAEACLQQKLFVTFCFGCCMM